MPTSAEEQTDTKESADAELSTPLLISMVLIKAGTHESLLDRLKKDWNAPIYAFFQPIPNVDHDNRWRFHEFTCAAKGCKKKIRHYLDTKDAKSTSNLQKHAKQCCGSEKINAADQMKDASDAQ